MKQQPMAHDAYRAISSSSRRVILNLLRERERTVGELVDSVEMTQPAVSQHLKVLQEAGLVRYRREGRSRVYQLNAAPLREIYDWLGHYERFWRRKLNALGDYLDEEYPDE
jgi:DNA-binding transcriptional ArsR family regulator